MPKKVISNLCLITHAAGISMRKIESLIRVFQDIPSQLFTRKLR